MYLGPHHFQAERSYFENSIHFANEALWFAPWGLGGIEIDREALRNGTLSLVHARGIFADGLAFHIPESDAPPPARNIADDFPLTQHQTTVLLAIPAPSDLGANTLLPNSPNGVDHRFVAQEESLFDETTGVDKQPVQFARKNFRFLLDSEPADNLITLPVARIVRDGAGFALDEKFIPPCLSLRASPRLLLMCRQLLDILGEKSRNLAGTGTSLGDLSAGLSARQVASFWFLHAVNTALASLRHVGFVKYPHPEELYRVLATLGGALCTFGLDMQPNQLPLYDHNNLTATFEQLDNHIRDHLELLQPTRCIEIPLQPSANYTFEGDVTDSRTLGKARWILGIHSSVSEAALIASAPKLVKICSARFVGELVRRALPGLDLTHLSIPPAAISPRVEFQYFGITRSGPGWDDIVKSKRVGVYVPGELPNPEIQLMAILES